MNPFRSILYFAFVVSLTACMLPTLYKDHQLARGRVTKVWTNEAMVEDWRDNIKSLHEAPDWDEYIQNYQVGDRVC